MEIKRYLYVPVLLFNIELTFIIFLVLLALPVHFIKELKDMEGKEGNTARLCCELTKPGHSVKWRKGSILLHSSDKHEIIQKGSTVELLIHLLKVEDSGEYTCDTGDQKTKSCLKVIGR